VDASDFFTRCRFPKLWYLHLSRGIKISSWECLGSHTTALTTLHLEIEETSRDPTTSQMLSILASNPRLQNLTLNYTIPHDDGGRSAFRVPLHYLKKLSLRGVFRHVFRLLHRLDHPETVDEMTLFVSGCTVEDIMVTFGPYVRDYLRRDRRVQDGFGISVDFAGPCVSIQASNGGGPTWGAAFATFTAMYQEILPRRAVKKLQVDFVAFAPREQVVRFRGAMRMEILRKIVPTMPGIKELHLTDAVLTYGFLQPDSDGPLAGAKLLPSLRLLHLEDLRVDYDDWSPLLPYLVHQTSGGQVVSLTLSGKDVHICTYCTVSVDEVKALVDELILDLPVYEDCRLVISIYSARMGSGSGGGKQSRTTQTTQMVQPPGKETVPHRDSTH